MLSRTMSMCVKRERVDRKMIVMSFDHTDADTLQALFMHVLTGADLLVLVPMPNYTQVAEEVEDHADKNPFLGFKYSANNLNRYPAMSLDRYIDNKTAAERIMDIVYAQIRDVYNETEMPEGVAKGLIYIRAGATNSISPSHKENMFKDWNTYGIHPRCPMDPFSGAFHNLEGPCDKPNFGNYERLIVDFSGSAAGFTEELLTDMSACIDRYMVVMGGTIGNVPNRFPKCSFINQHPETSMNQLYHPERSAKLLKWAEDYVIYVVPMGVVGNYARIMDIRDHGEALESFLNKHNLHGEALRKYIKMDFSVGASALKKPSNFYSALVVSALAKDLYAEGKRYILSLDPVMARTLLFPERREIALKRGALIAKVENFGWDVTKEEDKVVARNGEMLPDDITPAWDYYKVIVPDFKVENGAVSLAEVKA